MSNVVCDAVDLYCFYYVVQPINISESRIKKQETPL